MKGMFGGLKGQESRHQVPAQQLDHDAGLYALLFFVFFAAVFDPLGRICQLKHVAFAVLCLFAAFSWFRGRLCLFMPGVLFWAAFAVLIPAYGLLATWLRAGSLSLGMDSVYLSGGGFLAYALLLSTPARVGIAIRALDAVLMLLVGCVVLGAPLLLVEFVWPWLASVFAWPLLAFLLDKGIAFSGLREYAGIYFVNLYFFSAPMLLFVAVRRWHEFFGRKTAATMLIAGATSLALLLTGTRACMVLAVLTPLVVWIWRKWGFWSAVLAMLGCVVSVVAFASQHIALKAMLAPTEHSNAIKLAYLTHYMQIFSEPVVLWWGQGFNAFAWSPEVQRMVVGGAQSTELTYLELIRVYGLVVGALAAVLLAAPVFLWQRSSPAGWQFLPIAWFLFLMLALSNPYVFSSTGMTLFGITFMAMLHGRVVGPDGLRNSNNA